MTTSELTNESELMRRVEAAYLEFGRCAAEESAATSDLATETAHLLCADKFLRLVTKEEADAVLLEWTQQDKERLKNGNDILQTLTSAEHDVPVLPKWLQMAMWTAERNAREQYEKVTVKDLAKSVKKTLRARVDDAKERWQDARKETLASYERYEEFASAATAQTLEQVETKQQLVRDFEKANHGKKTTTVARLAQVPSAVDFKPYYRKRDFDFGPFYRMPDDLDSENTTSEVEEALRRPPCACDQTLAEISASEDAREKNETKPPQPAGEPDDATRIATDPTHPPLDISDTNVHNGDAGEGSTKKVEKAQESAGARTIPRVLFDGMLGHFNLLTPPTD
ncbi:unnamed protein product, partial [Mesorhabditis spiculigera]